MPSDSNGGSIPSTDPRIAMLDDVSRAMGLAQALAHPISKEIRPGSTEECAAEIVVLLERTREAIFRDL